MYRRLITTSSMYYSILQIPAKRSRMPDTGWWQGPVYKKTVLQSLRQTSTGNEGCIIRRSCTLSCDYEHSCTAAVRMATRQSAFSSNYTTFIACEHCSLLAVMNRPINNRKDQDWLSMKFGNTQLCKLSTGEGDECRTMDCS